MCDRRGTDEERLKTATHSMLDFLLLAYVAVVSHKSVWAMHTAVRPIHIQLFTRVPNTRQHFRFALYAIETDRFHVTRENIVGEVRVGWTGLVGRAYSFSSTACGRSGCYVPLLRSAYRTRFEGTSWLDLESLLYAPRGPYNTVLTHTNRVAIYQWMR